LRKWLRLQYKEHQIIAKEVELRRTSFKPAVFPEELAMRIGILLSRSMQKALPDGPASKTVHHFLGTVEAAVRQYLNSVLVDAELH
jgi:hypothetical protein